MAKDDYFVIMYMLLRRLYDYLKKGKFISDEEMNELAGHYNETYWRYILLNMQSSGFIEGVSEVQTLTGHSIKCHNVQITPTGIEYLFSNSMMERVKNALKDIKGIVPGV